MKLNKKTLAAILTALVAVLGAVAKLLEEPAAELPDVEVPVVDVAADAGL